MILVALMSEFLGYVVPVVLVVGIVLAVEHAQKNKGRAGVSGAQGQGMNGGMQGQGVGGGAQGQGVMQNQRVRMQEPVKTPEELEREAEARRKRSEQIRLNVALYVGSLLVVAGAGSLVGLGGNGRVGLVFLTTLMLVCYVSGVLMRMSARLKMAGQAFVLTGAVILPFLGMVFAEVTRYSEVGAMIVVVGAMLLAVMEYAFIVGSKEVGRKVVGQVIVGAMCGVALLASLSFRGDVGEDTVVGMGAVLFAILFSVVMCYLVKRRTGYRGWLYGTLLVMLNAPMMLLSGMTGSYGASIMVACYLVELVAVAVVLGVTQPRDTFTDVMVGVWVGGGLLSVLSLCILPELVRVGQSGFWSAAAWGVSGLTLLGYGWVRKKRVMMELGWYGVVLGACRLVLALLMRQAEALSWMLVAQLVAGGLIVAGIGWAVTDKNEGSLAEKIGKSGRVLAGLIVLVALMMLVALVSGDMAVAVTFLLEAAVILIIGVGMKAQRLWVTGAVGTVLAGIWFTRTVPYVWLVLVGVTVMAVVIVKLLMGGKEEAKERGSGQIGGNGGVVDEGSGAVESDEGWREKEAGGEKGEGKSE